MFLDYGDMNEVPRNEILQLPDKFLLLPFQAIQCGLADATCSDAWSDDAIEAFEQLTRRQDVIKRLPLKVPNSFSLPHVLSCIVRYVVDKLSLIF